VRKIIKEPWFGKKRIGWGIRPITWQGWMLSLIFLVIIIGLSLLVLVNYNYVWQLESINLLVIFVFILIAYMTTDKINTNKDK
jgi:MFS superfamily sulfate permease-like transporter